MSGIQYGRHTVAGASAGADVQYGNHAVARDAKNKSSRRNKSSAQTAMLRNQMAQQQQHILQQQAADAVLAQQQQQSSGIYSPAMHLQGGMSAAKSSHDARQATVFAPPVDAKALVPDLPSATLSCRSGSLKVVAPSPAP